MVGWDKNRNREETQLLEQLEDGENKGGVLGQGRVTDHKRVLQSREKFTNTASLMRC